MVKICGWTQNDEGEVAEAALSHCRFDRQNDAVAYLNKLTQVLKPDAGYEGEHGYWWVRSKNGVTRYTIQA